MTTPKAKWRKEFVPEYLYIEEYYYPCPIEKSSDKKLKPEEEENRGVVIIDLVTYEEEK